MFEQVAGENEIHAPVFDHVQICNWANVTFNTRLEVLYHAWPEVDRDAPAASNVINEVPISCAKLQHTVCWVNEALEIVVAQSLPKNVAAAVIGEPRLVILFHGLESDIRGVTRWPAAVVT
jgi:hypothetical protein